VALLILGAAYLSYRHTGFTFFGHYYDLEFCESAFLHRGLHTKGDSKILFKNIYQKEKLTTWEIARIIATLLYLFTPIYS